MKLPTAKTRVRSTSSSLLNPALCCCLHQVFSDCLCCGVASWPATAKPDRRRSSTLGPQLAVAPKFFQTLSDKNLFCWPSTRRKAFAPPFSRRTLQRQSRVFLCSPASLEHISYFQKRVRPLVLVQGPGLA